MALDAETVAEMARRIEAMREMMRSQGVQDPFTVFVPKPLFDALAQSGHSLPYDVRFYPVVEKRKKLKPRYGRKS